MPATLIPNAKLRLYRHAGHAFLFQDSRVFTAGIEGF